jgi:hypothetical protein
MKRWRAPSALGLRSDVRSCAQAKTRRRRSRCIARTVPCAARHSPHVEAVELDLLARPRGLDVALRRRHIASLRSEGWRWRAISASRLLLVFSPTRQSTRRTRCSEPDLAPLVPGQLCGDPPRPEPRRGVARRQSPVARGGGQSRSASDRSCREASSAVLRSRSHPASRSSSPAKSSARGRVASSRAVRCRAPARRPPVIGS